MKLNFSTLSVFKLREHWAVHPFSRMKFHLAVLAIVATSYFSCVSGVFWDDLRITSGADPTIHFQRLPRTVLAATTANWVAESNTTVTDCAYGAFQGIRYVESNDDSIALLYDRNGIIAGIQAQIPHSEIMKPNNTFRFERVPMFQNITIRGQPFFVLTAYFINPDKICTEGRTEYDLIERGTGEGLWFQNGPTAQYLIDVSKTRAEALTKGWSRNNCWRAMGNHNFWQTEKYEEHSCNEIQPTFVLYDENDDTMQGFGFTIPGSVNLPRYESPPNAVIGAIINPTPPCLTAMNDRVGAATLHIYFIDQPWLINCA